MVFGIMGESLEDMRQRHIKETLEDKVGWEKELEIAKKA